MPKIFKNNDFQRPSKLATKMQQILPPTTKMISPYFPMNFAFKLFEKKLFTIVIIFCTLSSTILRFSNAMENNNIVGQEYQQQSADIPLIPPLSYGPLRQWREKRMVRCIFCMNYDDYNNLSTFGCEWKRIHMCWGNFCYMRQHKRQDYFLYTSGCVNLSTTEMLGLKTNVAALANESGLHELASSNWGNETQLCEVGQSVNTCVCTNRHLCNNVTAVDPYIEYSDAIFAGIEFDELAHFRFLMPDDPILLEFERGRSVAGGGNGNGGGNYALVKDSASAHRQMPILLFFLLLLLSCGFSFSPIFLNSILNNKIKYSE